MHSVKQLNWESQTEDGLDSEYQSDSNTHTNTHEKTPEKSHEKTHEKTHENTLTKTHNKGNGYQVIDEFSARRPLCAKLPVTDTELFGTTASGADIANTIGKLFPLLHPQLPHMKRFAAAVQDEVARAPPFKLPDIQKKPTNWASTNPELDRHWQAAVQAD